ncbi:MAG: amidohydrolase family protein [Eubacteriales bacterium]
MRIIDCHCHVYPEKIASRAVSGIGEFYDLPLRHDGALGTLLRLEREAGVTHLVIFSVATKPAQADSINDFIARTVQSDPDGMTGLGTLHPDSPTIAADIRRIKSLGLKGVKLHPDFQQFRIDDPRCLKIYEACEGELPILMHTGDFRFDFSNPNRMQPMLEAFPHLTFIGAHFGGWSVWDEAVARLQGYDNFYVDCSSSLYALSPEKARDIIRAYGADHVLFGVDYPMWTPKQELERLLALGLTAEEYSLILHRNSERLFDISPLSGENSKKIPQST